MRCHGGTEEGEDDPSVYLDVYKCGRHQSVAVEKHLQQADPMACWSSSRLYVLYPVQYWIAGFGLVGGLDASWSRTGTKYFY